MEIEFFVPGIPRPAGSKKGFTNPKTGKQIITHDNPKTKDWMDSVKWFAMKTVGRMPLLEEAVKLEITCIYSRPKFHYGTGRNSGKLRDSAPRWWSKTTKPDLTKLVRAIEDALTGIVWKDDSCVVQQSNSKLYCENDDPIIKPGIRIKIKTIVCQNREHYD